ncbi:hypothetical protein K493DRAFT_310992 [Basidiobolus meristosporus CBS 931.73]|uniref:PAS domain-containing protein n=1 Tax=Basidiobolus meristosporus CBS 931.73 TaxID=1314790 RepID=A0A1Y1Z5A1_9FUNG|nr:hypothetical protein K493DRAFT_317590 [Basidiobolus meristosporus CBS 931.73]ORY05468.1 hypothetical protein K493DRAFT_310992 [Basidiobolus meristosporus CBS 931.73]|eukprot:ORX90978.1 hypothetical protein K493DRAFT_317590 [Basidiobolus meristosporus CBS 931.73]
MGDPRGISFFGIYEATRSNQIIYLSESVSDALGFEPDELVGKSTFDYYHPDDLTCALNVFDDCIRNQRLGAIIHVRVRGKFGWVEIEVVWSFCHNIIFHTNRLIRGPDRFEESRMGSPMIAAQPGSSESQSTQAQMNPPLELAHPAAAVSERLNSSTAEPRVGLVLNRFSYYCYIQYCSELVGYMFGISQKEILGNSFLSYIHPSDLERVEEQLTCIKSQNIFLPIAFTLVSPYGDMPVQGVFSATMDGIVAVIRQATSQFPLDCTVHYFASANR